MPNHCLSNCNSNMPQTRLQTFISAVNPSQRTPEARWAENRDHLTSAVTQLQDGWLLLSAPLARSYITVLSQTDCCSQRSFGAHRCQKWLHVRHIDREASLTLPLRRENRNEVIEWAFLGRGQDYDLCSRPSTTKSAISWVHQRVRTISVFVPSVCNAPWRLEPRSSSCERGTVDTNIAVVPRMLTWCQLTYINTLWEHTNWATQLAVLVRIKDWSYNF